MRSLIIRAAIAATIMATFPAPARAEIDDARAKATRHAVFQALGKGASPAIAWGILSHNGTEGSSPWREVVWIDRERISLGMHELPQTTPVIVFGSTSQRMASGYMVDLGLGTQVYVRTKRNHGLEFRQDAVIAGTYTGPITYIDRRGFDHTVPSILLNAILHRQGEP